MEIIMKFVNSYRFLEVWDRHFRRIIIHKEEILIKAVNIDIFISVLE